MDAGRRGRVSRRAFLRRAAAASAVGWHPGLWTPARAAAAHRTAATVFDPAGTTLASTLGPTGSGPYRSLAEGPPWPIVVRADLAEPKAGREDRRHGVAAVVHLTDIHVIDAQSPARVEFTDRFGPPFESAFRAQETLTTQVGTAMVRRLNAIGRGPVTGRPFDVAVSTGDNIDNQQLNEMEWFFTILDGGSVTPDSGAIGEYEGVQDGVGPDLHYWHPEPGIADQYKTTFGFPDYPGLLDAAVGTITSPGLATPWYSTYGNHDGLVQGNVNGWLPGGVKPLDLILVGSIKPVNLSAVPSPADLAAWAADPALLAQHLTSQLSDNLLPARVVTADPARRAVSPSEWAQRHLDSPTTPGPAGHGYTEANVADGTLHYTFPIAPGVLGISLDTVNRGGYADGSLSQAQLAWLEARLVEAHARYYDPAGSVVATGHSDQLVLLFSHHNLFTLGNPIPDPADLTPRVFFPQLHALLSRFPNVIAWVNGHSHVNRITPVADGSGRTGGFWEISTAAHVDWPEHARILEIADNRDGTLSIFATIVDHDGPAAADDEAWLSSDPDRQLLALAAVSRELSVNDPQTSVSGKLGAPHDLNVELLVTAPFTFAPPLGAAPGTAVPAPPAAAAELQRTAATGPPIPAGTGLAIGGAALATALAIRRRLEA